MVVESGHSRPNNGSGERMPQLRLIAMVALVVAGLSLLVIGPMDDRSIDWVNVVLALACFAGAIYLRPRKTKNV